jgi:hypothetical protein
VLSEGVTEDDPEPHWLDTKSSTAANSGDSLNTEGSTITAEALLIEGDECIDIDAPELLEALSSGAGDANNGASRKGKEKEKEGDDTVMLTVDDDDGDWSF